MPRPNRGPRLSDQPNDRGYWEIVWCVKGRPMRESTRTKNHSEANLYFARWLLGLQDAVAEREESAGLTVREVCDYYLTEHVAALPSALSRKHVSRALGSVVSGLGDLPVKELADEHVRRYVRRRGEGLIGWTDDGVERPGRKATPASCRYDLTFLIAALNYAVKNRRLSRAELPELTLPKPGDPRVHFLTPEEAARLIQVAAPKPGQRMSRLYRLLVLGLSTAARQEAMLELTWDRVNFATGTIDYRKPGRAVTKKRRVVVPMSDDLRDMLKAAYAQRNSEYVLDEGPRVSLLFMRALKRAGITVPKGSAGTHLMRHTWASWSAQAGLSMTHIAAVLGDTVATTEKHYAKLAPETLAHVVNHTPLPGIDRGVSSGVTPRSGPNIVQYCPTVSEANEAESAAMPSKMAVGQS